MFTEALADTQAYRRLNSPWYWANLAEIYARSGRKVEAERALKELLQLNRREPVDPNIVADAYAELGDKNQALAWLEKACARHSIEFTKLKVFPAYDPLRGDPRFQDLLLRVGFAN